MADNSTDSNQGRLQPFTLLALMAVAMPLAFSVWQALLNNFSIDRAAFTGAEIGILQSLREVPGFLSFTVVFLLIWFREQRIALVSMMVMGIGVAITGFFPSVIGLYLTTVLMSFGFHYYEAVNQSLALQWLDKSDAAHNLGRLIAFASGSSLLAYGSVYVALEFVGLSMETVYLIGGLVTLGIAIYAYLKFPVFPEQAEQIKKPILRKRYWLFYALTFMSGARRQIFIVFAGFLMVEKFGFDAAAIAAMFFLNGAINMWAAPRIGKLIVRWGERRALTLEYIGLICIFSAYAFVDSPWLAVLLYVLDHLFFSMAIAIKTYFQKIADPREVAPTASVAFTINHIAAVVLPVLYGALWLIAPAAVFLTGAALSLLSLMLAQMIPDAPERGAEIRRRTTALTS